MPLHVRRIGDTLIPIRVKLVRKSDGDPVDLTGLSVTFKMIEKSTGYTKAEDTATVIDAANGLVEYDFTSYDVDTAGDFYAYFVVSDGSETDHFPVDSGNLIVRINEDIPAEEE